MNSNITLGLYVHIPWCIKKCPYCDFNSHELKADHSETDYLNCLLSDLDLDLDRFSEIRPISHIFIGGGTPSLFKPESIAKLITGIKKRCRYTDALEITMEANPGTFESVKFAEFRLAGINRLSIGIQSFDDDCLRRLGRVHNSSEAVRAVEIAWQAGFENFNLDLMFGLPEAEAGISLSDIKTAISLQPKHISLYQLTLEPNTYFHKFPPRLPSQDAVIEEQNKCQTELQLQGYSQYEISAYTQKGYQCQHNLNYWKFGDYLGIGAGAHGKISMGLPDQIIRYSKPKNPDKYMQAITVKQPERIEQTVKLNELALEFVMNQLRLLEGFSIEHYQHQTGLTAASIVPMLNSCVEQGLIEQTEQRYYCSPKGWNFLDSILQEFVPD